MSFNLFILYENPIIAIMIEFFRKKWYAINDEH